MKISIIIPILNEKNNIIKLSKLIIKNLKKIDFEVLFVDDNSIDGTAKILKNISNLDNRLKYIIRKKKRDLCQSCFEGIEKSKNQIIVIMDGDLQHHPKYIKPMLLLFIKRKADIVIGARNFKKKIVGLSKFRKFFSIVLIKIINILLAKKTADPMSGFFIFNKKIYLSNKKKLFGKGFKILCDFIFNSKKNLIIFDYEINFKLRNNGKSKMNIKTLVFLILFILKKFLINIIHKRIKY